MTSTLARLESRRKFSRERLGALASEMKKIKELKHLTGLCVYATGSYARGEASSHSDLDLFFVNSGSAANRIPNLDQLRVFARVIDAGARLKFPTFSNDGEFLDVLYFDDLLEKLGGRADDYHNYFTARMLLLLESVPLINVSMYKGLMNQVVESYFRDYPDHSDEFRPVFLINDILRFWKTLCLNYEHRRNKPEDDKLKKRKQQVKNFKLKFSRLMSCFGTVVAISATQAPINQEFIVGLTNRVPLDRFRDATAYVPELQSVVNDAMADYSWFMTKTKLSAERLTALFDNTADKTEMFDRAETFGSRVFEVLDYFCQKERLQ